MTLKDMVKQNEPTCVDDVFTGGVAGCPNEYPYLNCADIFYTCSDKRCTDCWNREYKLEEDIMNQKEIRPIFGTWIKCEDMMPEHDQWVIVCTKDEFITAMQYDASDPPCFLDDHDEFFATYDVVAWMPRPELPEGV